MMRTKRMHYKKGYLSLVLTALLLSSSFVSLLGVVALFSIPVHAQDSDGLLYSFVHFSDTQTLVQSYPETLNYTFQWIESKKSEWNITAIIVTGDLVQTYNDTSQWQTYVNAKSLTSIPVFEVAGNHDNNNGEDFSYYNNYIGSNETFYTANLTDRFTLIGISWNTTNNIVSDSYIQELKDEIATHSDRYFIIATHWYMGEHSGDPTVLSSLGSLIYNELYLNYPDNVVLVLCGHITDGGIGVKIANTRDGLHEYMTNIQGENASYVRVFKVYSNNTIIMELYRLIPQPVELVETDSFQLPSKPVVIGGWLEGWAYRKRITIQNNVAQDITDYQINFTLYYGSGSDSGFIIHLNNHSRTDFGDIRFALANGTLLNYWVEEKVDSDYAFVWVRIPKIPASGTIDVYLYYGNPNATSVSNGEATFLLFDDFDGTALDTSKWIDYSRSLDLAIENGYLRIYGTRSVSEYNYIASVNTYPRGIAIMYRAMLYSYSGTVYRIYLSRYQQDAENVTSQYTEGCWATTDDAWRLRAYDGATSYTQTLSGSYSTGVWYRFELIILQNGARYVTKDGVLELTETYPVGDNHILLGSSGTSGSSEDSRFDWVAVRKYVEPAPSIAGIGSEEARAAWLLGWGYRKSHEILGSVAGNVTNYQVKIVAHYGSGIDSGEDFYCNGHCNPDFSDIRFTASDGVTLLSYWMEEKYDGDNATFWVKVPYIPASPDKTVIYVYYGKDDAEYAGSGKDTFLEFYDFSTDESTNWAVYSGTVTWDIANGVLKATYQGTESRAIATINVAYGAGVAIRTKMKAVNWDSDDNGMGLTVMLQDSSNFYYPRLHYVRNQLEFKKAVAGTYTTVTNTSFVVMNDVWYLFEVQVISESHIRVVADSVELDVTSGLEAWSSGYPGIYTFNSYKDADAYVLYDWWLIRKYVDPEPSHGGWGAEETPIFKVVRLPSESLFLIHEVAYSPNASQFSHSFTATNDSVAGFETGYGDAYGWRLYANPYSSGGTNYENTASLVSKINITLPYGSVLVENLTLLAKTGGTGSYRRLWVKLLDSSGGLVAELVNASISMDWTEVSLNVNASLSGSLTIWINTTVTSTTQDPEELAVKDVQVFVRHDATPEFSAFIVYGVDYFNFSSSHYVELGSLEYLNSSIITLKLISYLKLNATDYPVAPAYVRNETVGSHSYAVYRIQPANYSQYLTVYALLENILKTFRTSVKGYDTTSILVGDTLTIELPEAGNISIPALGKVYLNVASVTLKFLEPGSYEIRANITKPNFWKIGIGRKIVNVGYGLFYAKPLDLDSNQINYEELRLVLINETDGSLVSELVGNTLFSLTGLWAGNYTLKAFFKDILTASMHFEFSTASNASVLSLPCMMKRLTPDYRAINRTIVLEFGKSLVKAESLSEKYPLSRMRLLINGTGSFKLYINYGHDLPTNVLVRANVSNLSYYWDGSYLVITGSLGSLGELNITDLYKLKVEIYDRLNRTAPSWFFLHINQSKYSGSIIEDYLYPEDYVIELPKVLNGFEFYRFFDGYNSSTRIISVNNSDAVFRVWYKIPTKVKSLQSLRVQSLVDLIPFIHQTSDKVTVYVDGQLLDYYGSGVPNRPLIVYIINRDLNTTRRYVLTTDASGYFRTDLVELLRGYTYDIKVEFAGDDVYAGAVESLEFVPEELPTAPVIVMGIPITYIVLLVIVVIAIVAIVIAILRSSRHVVSAISESKKRFVKKKRWVKRYGSA